VRIEIEQDKASTVGGVTVASSDVRVFSFANREGNLEARRTAVLTIDAATIEVEEGSQINIGDRSWLVVRIRRKNGRGLVRLRGIHDTGRFASAIARFDDRGTSLDTSMVFLVAGVNAVHDTISRIDEHPDTVGTFADPLSRAQKFLQHACRSLSEAGASVELLAYANRYETLCTSLLETVLSSTQERELDT
jgi:hypothetical protein